MRVLGIDYGLRRIGLAVTDGYYPSPIKYIVNKGPNKNLVQLQDIIKRHEIKRVVLGDPMRGVISKEVKEFADLLRCLWVEVVFHDESYTSWEAEEYIKEKLGIKDPKKIAEMVDSIAACMLLNSWLKTK